MDKTKFPTIQLDQLSTACGGAGFLRRAWDTAVNTFGYAGPAGASEAASAMQPAAGALALGPQGAARNNLINTLASPTSSGGQQDAAWDRYSNGPGQKLAKQVSGW